MSNPILGLDAAQFSYDDQLPINRPPGEKLGADFKTLADYHVDLVFDPPGRGVTAYAMSDTQGNIVLAFRGSDDGRDWIDNLGSIGYSQWEVIQAQVMQYLDDHKKVGQTVTFAGHSVGGALAEYAAYDAMSAGYIAPETTELYTFNAPGAYNALNFEHGAGYNGAMLNGIEAIHFLNPEDFVARLGGLHLTGTTIIIPDQYSGPDGIIAAHSVDQFTPDILAAGEVGARHLLNFSAFGQDSGPIVEVINAFIDLAETRPSNWQLSQLDRIIDAIDNVPTSIDALETIAYLIAGIEVTGVYYAEELSIALGNKIIDLGEVLVGYAEKIIIAADALEDRTKAALISAAIDVIIFEFTAIGKAGDATVNAFGAMLDAVHGLGQWLGGTIDAFSQALVAQLVRLTDPIVLDLDGNGIELSSRLNSGVYFDMDGDGIRELTGWVSPTDGLLSIDGNGNGLIDGISELIGDLGRSGFAELVTYDLNGDHLIDADDAIWSQMRVWVDANSDGVTDAGELKTLAELSIASIDLKFTAVNFTAEGNKIHEHSIFEYTDGTAGLIADIWFDVSNVATNSEVTLTGNVTIDDLPDIRGRGDVESLRSVMVADAALATLVSGFVALQLDQLGNAHAQVEQILYRWAGAQDVDPTSRGGLFDGRELATLEAFLGTDFFVQGSGNPNAQSIANLTLAWDGLVDGVMARLLMAGTLGAAVSDALTYVPQIDRLLSVQSAAELLASFADAAPDGDGLAVAGYWAAVLPLAREAVQDIGGETATPAYNALVAAALAPSGLAPFAGLLDDGISGVPAGTVSLSASGVFRLSNGSDVLTLSGGISAVFAGDGNDQVGVSSSGPSPHLLDGGAGDDLLKGGTGDDWLDGGSGVDTMSGGAGNDVYTVDVAGDLVQELPGAGIDEVRSNVSYTLGADVENLTLLGGSNLDGFGNDANNAMFGNSANNALLGGTGRDILTGGAGADTFVFQALTESGNTLATADRITDFNIAQGDRIDLGVMDAAPDSVIDDTFSFIGTAKFSAIGQIRTVVTAGVTYVQLNTDLNFATSEMMIAMTGNLVLDGSMFVL